jgi:hypothetical protein
MFGTFRYDARGNETDCTTTAATTGLLHSAQTTAGLFPPHLACENCRVKKVNAPSDPFSSYLS